VVAFFVEQGLLPARLSAAGYAEFHPRVLNESETNRARNRRVDVVVLNPITVAREEPRAGAQPSVTGPDHPF
jgi:chemotaxis protein MotB